MDLHSSKGTRVAQVKVVGMEEGITAELHLVDNASQRVVLTGNDILLSQNLVDDSTMSITVEAAVGNSFIDETLKVQVKPASIDDKAILEGEISEKNDAVPAHALESNASANLGDANPHKVPGATGFEKTTEPMANPVVGSTPDSTKHANSNAIPAHATANFRLDSEGDHGDNVPRGHAPSEPMTVSNAQNRANTVENKVNTKIDNADRKTSNVEGDSRNANAEFVAGRVNPPEAAKEVAKETVVTRDPDAKQPDTSSVVKKPHHETVDKAKTGSKLKMPKE
jgi:hypothetical protein